MKLIPNARAAWRHYSTQALALGDSITSAWTVFPDDLKAAMGPDALVWIARITALILVWGLVGKFIDQGPKGAP